ncbi:MAG TPA: 2-oxoacid:acceptor oxidoreductase subunit alpha [Rhodospirillales bacterium]|nr:2-oxoacid:acceptor oxidoreductase subunit alpha [Rhodospirillales bacterium]
MVNHQTDLNSLSIAITGSGGAGVITAGNMLLEAAARAGLYGLFMRSSGPQIRGGEAAAMVRLGTGPVDAPGEEFHILIAIDWHNIDRFAIELPLSSDSLVIADPAQGDVPQVISASGARIVELPLKQMAKAIPKGRANMIALGALAKLIGLPADAVDGILEKVLKKRAAEALESSRAAIAAGAAAAGDIKFAYALSMPIAAPDKRWMISGNEATGMGAVRGGVRFVAAYPITPATEVLEWLSPALKKVGGALVQAEDELASINMIIGASYGGTPSLTATSGPGLALMLESIGLAVASEIPIVVVDVMRGGPSTGIPTKSEQSDLNIAVFGLHGDAPHIVVAPTSVADCLFASQWAVHLAEVLQVPAIVLSDQMLGQTRAIIDQPPDLAFVSRRVLAEAEISDYHRYALASGGVSPMTLPGRAGGQYTADGLEHNEFGDPSSQVTDHVAQLDKRSNKISEYDFGDHWAEIEGDGDLAVITWGSSTGVVREALRELSVKGRSIRLIAPRLLAPASPARMANALAGVERALVIELSHSGQFYHYLKGYFELPCPVASYCRAGPLPYRAAELVSQIENWSESPLS